MEIYIPIYRVFMNQNDHYLLRLLRECCFWVGLLLELSLMLFLQSLLVFLLRDSPRILYILPQAARRSVNATTVLGLRCLLLYARSEPECGLQQLRFALKPACSAEIFLKIVSLILLTINLSISLYVQLRSGMGM